MLFDMRLLAVALLSAVVTADDTAAPYNEIEKAANQSLLWGPYRPNVYFGITPRIPKSFMGGLMWSKVEDYEEVQHSKLHC